jgi:hypothetical protein
MDDSTTPVSTDTGAEASAQPDTSVDTQAADTQPDVSTATVEPSDTSEATTAVDDNLKWLQDNKGFDPNSPDALAKVAEMYRNAETQLRSTRNDAKLDTSITDAAQESDLAQANPTPEWQQELNQLKLERNVDKFFGQEGVDAAMRPKMAEAATANPNLAYLVETGVLSLQDMYNMVRGSDPTLLNQAKTDGAREALTAVKDRQQAKAVPGNATSSAMATGGPTRETRDAWYSGLTPEQRASPETQRTLASLL